MYAFVVCSFATVMNLCAIGILLNNKKLKKSRFHTLVLYLSISDCCIAVHYIVHSVFNYLDDGASITQYGCMVLKHCIGGTVGFSEWQTLMICLERLHAMYPHEKPLLKKLTSDRSVIISFIVCQLYTFLPLIYEITYGPQPCHVSYTTKITFVLSIDIPLMCYYLSIVILYAVLLRQIITKSKNRVADNTSILSMKTKHEAMKRMRMNMLTLGIIIAVTSVSIIPRELGAVFSLFMENDDIILRIVMIGNYTALINPLVDPVIYVIRIKEVRDKVACLSFRNQIHPQNINVRAYEQQNLPPNSGLSTLSIDTNKS